MKLGDSLQWWKLTTSLGCHGNIVAMREALLSLATVEASDCLIEGSKKDAISHFTLR